MELNPSTTAVIAVHLQHDVVSADGAYTRVAWRSDFSDLVANSPILGIVAQSRCLAEGSDKAQIVPELTPAAEDVVVTHQRVGGFSSSQLDVILRSRGIDTVVFAGVATNFSVEGTARQASDLGYRVIVVEDACSAADPAAHDASIGSLGLLAEIASSHDLVEALTGAGVSAV